MANDILQFCGTDSGTNLDTQSEYAAATDRTTGNQPGVARSKLVNKALRQSSLIASQFAQYISNLTGGNVLDNGVPAAVLVTMGAALDRLPQNLRAITSGSGTYGLSYYFTVTSANATLGATYTNNAFTFTVVKTIASGTLLLCTSTGAPAASGTLTKSGGTGDSTITFSAVRAPIAIQVQAIGAGGGGGGVGTSGAGDGGAGGNTTFSTYTAGGGNGGTKGTGASVGAGGTPNANAGSPTVSIQGGSGGCAFISSASLSANQHGGPGGNGFFGGGAVGRVLASDGTNAEANSGGGGSGAAGSASVYPGGGGAAGNYFCVIIQNPSATYSYGIGAGGLAGTQGTSGNAGGIGGSGILIITEIF